MTRRVQALSLAVVAGAIYLNVLGNGFVSDDWHMVVDNEWLRDVSNLAHIFGSEAWAFVGQEPSSYYRPLMHVVYMLVYLVFGASTIAFHAVNVLAHAGTSLLVFALIRRILRDESGWASWIGALLFAVHPVHVEAVAWVSALPDIVCTGLLVASLLAFLAAGDDDRRASILHVAGSAAFLAAVLFKEPAVLLPGIVLMVDLARRPARATPSWWLTRYGGLGAATAIYWALRLHALDGMASAGHDVRLLGVLKVAGAVAWQYAAILVIPYPLNVVRSADSPVALPWWLAILALIAVLVIPVVRRSVRWTTAAAAFALPLIPSLVGPGILHLDIPWAERYAYAPSVGLAIAAALVAARWTTVRRRQVVFAVIPVLALLSGIVMARNPVWRDDLVLWTDAVAKAPRSGTAHLYLGHALLVRGQTDRAVVELQRAATLKPGNADTLVNLGAALATRGLHAAAVPVYREAIRLRPGEPVAHVDLAVSLSTLGQHAEAYREARRAIDVRPRFAKAHFALGMALGNAGDIAGAVAAFRRAAELDPTDEMTRANLAKAESILASRTR